uniref:Uncharacterized protein n=1 Tax=Candidatus Kentrum sp. MB TaxID=2138164 RepID=A0A450X0T7_9GAMM|nr:MAG: hypothetical protein BECKMB1821G_GA0114241_100320 [Candidatus Kentron sp. MB]
MSDPSQVETMKDHYRLSCLVSIMKTQKEAENDENEPSWFLLMRRFHGRNGSHKLPVWEPFAPEKSSLNLEDNPDYEIGFLHYHIGFADQGFFGTDVDGSFDDANLFHGVELG